MIRALAPAGLLVATACVQQPPLAVSSVPTTAAKVVVEEESPITVTVHGPAATPYRSDILGSKPQNVAVDVTNDGDRPRDVSDLRIAFTARRGAVPFRCETSEAVPPREEKIIAPHATATFNRELCTLPLPGKYVIGVTATTGDTTRAASFDFAVHAGERNVPRRVPAYPGLFAALGGDLSGVRFTRPDWETGAYKVVLRVTNASMVPVSLVDVDMVFRVTKLHQPFACTDTKHIDLPRRLGSGESAIAKVPVTCILDVQGKYEIHAMIGDVELAEIHVEVTSDPLLYLPIWPW
ncbi:MAG TPA: hypothetical protein VH054_06635 [Polyangiaceae bacterium]|nr:hypothetical protein [Polyangiaceae bacterium]